MYQQKYAKNGLFWQFGLTRISLFYTIVLGGSEFPTGSGPGDQKPPADFEWEVQISGGQRTGPFTVISPFATEVSANGTCKFCYLNSCNVGNSSQRTGRLTRLLV